MPVIAGAELLTSLFGAWPSFHDAEVLRLALDRGADPSLLIRDRPALPRRAAGDDELGLGHIDPDQHPVPPGRECRDGPVRSAFGVALVAGPRNWSGSATNDPGRRFG